MNSRIKRRVKPEGSGDSFKLSIAGRIKIGEKAKSASGKDYPTSIDFFRVDASEPYARLVRERYGERPTVLQIVFYTEDEAEVLKNFYELRDPATGKKIASGDGERFELVRLKEGQVTTTMEEPASPLQWMEELAKRTGGKWKERLRMRFLLLGVQIFGAWEFNTGAEESTIPGILEAVDSMRALCGRISGIPFDLVIKKVKSDKAGPARTFPVVSLIGKFSAEDVEKVKELKAGFGMIAELSGPQVGKSISSPASSRESAKLPAGDQAKISFEK